MNSMVQRLSKTCNLGSKCCLPAIIWSLAAWILVLQAYTTFFPTHTPPADPQTPWRELPIYADIPERVEERLDDKFEYRLPAVAPTKEKLKNKTEEDIKELLAIKKLALLFPDKSLAINPLKANDSEKGYFYPGREWRDSEGRPIQAHGGGIIYVADTQTFYWYGENKDGRTYHPAKHGAARVDVLGVSCYSSKDLWTWKNEGLALKAEKTDKSSDLYASNVVERPKVIYNDHTKQYVMWMHIDSLNYSKAAAGVAVSPTPEGPFEYLGSKRPHGCESRDLALFKDDNGEAYIIYSSVANSELHIGTLTEDYLDVVGRGLKKLLVKQRREAPAVFKHRGMYYMVTSGCTWWAPNGALVHASESMMGPWTTLGDPCVGGEEEFRAFTFISQGTFVMPLPGLKDTFLFMADRWRPADLRDSRYVWLHSQWTGLLMSPQTMNLSFPLWLRVSIHWYEKWKLPEGWDKPANLALQSK